jgi:hypothetical protein
MDNTETGANGQGGAGSTAAFPGNGAGLAHDLIECPLCIGRGYLKCSEVLERLGMKDFTRVAQLSAEEAFRMLLKKQKDDESSLWLRFEAELTKRTNQLLERHRGEMTALEKEKSALELRLTEIQSNQETLLANTKESERLEAEKGLRHEILALEGKMKDLQAEQRVSKQRRLLEVEQVKTETENKLQTERAKSADLTRNVQDYLLEISKLRDENSGLQAEMSKIARIGRRE